MSDVAFTQPQALQKLSKILGNSRSLQNAATLYLHRECGFVPGPGHIVSKHLHHHPLLADYAHGDGFHPAIIFEAVNEVTGNRAIEVVYLTRTGELALISDPRLLLGALAGASVTAQASTIPNADILIFERVEVAMKASLLLNGTIVAAMRRSNILNLPILQAADGQHGPRVELWYPDGCNQETKQKWLDIAETLKCRGFDPWLLRLYTDQAPFTSHDWGTERYIAKPSSSDARRHGE